MQLEYVINAMISEIEVSEEIVKRHQNDLQENSALVIEEQTSLIKKKRAFVKQLEALRKN